MFETAYFERIIISALVIIAGLVFLLFIVSTILRLMKGRLKKSESRGLIKKAVIPLIIFIVLIALRVNLPLILKDTDLFSSAGQFISVLLIFCGAWIVINAIKISRFFILKKYDLSEKDNLQARKIYTQFRIIERILIFLIIFISIALALMTFESIRRIGVSLFASAGVAGIILGLAAQRALATILAGFQIAITQPIRLDDVVIVEGEWGWVEEITLTYVVVRIWDKRRLVVPTTYFIEKPFQNWTRVSADILGTVFIFADYTMPVGELRNEFEKYLQETELWDKKVGNVQVTNATSQTLEIRFLMSALDSPTLWDLRVLIREKLIDYLQKNHPDKLPRTRIEMKP